MDELIKCGGLEHFILLVRNNHVMIDRDLAGIYGVETKYLNRQVKRNPGRFPVEFMFQLNLKEKNELVTNWHRFATLKHSSSLPYVFTEHGVAMLATVLNSEKAIRMSIQIVKTFISVREFLSASQLFDERLTRLEEKVDNHFSLVIDAIDAMNTMKNQPMTPIGFKFGKYSKDTNQFLFEGTNRGNDSVKYRGRIDLNLFHLIRVIITTGSAGWHTRFTG